MSKKKNKTRGFDPPRPAAPAPAFPIWQLLLAAICIIAAGWLAYSNCFAGVFIFDDKVNILENQSIRQFWPPWASAFAPQNIPRPLAALTLALNYAISGPDPWSYHVFNLSVHILAALTLFGIVRRTLLTARLRERFGAASAPLAFVAALLWMLHPLQTQAVTYMIQRCESLMGLFYLLTLYCVVRGFSSSRQKLWHVAAVISCAAGAGCKQVIVTAPLVVWLYDLVFLSGSFLGTMKRWKLYAGLAASWVIVALTLALAPHEASAGFGLKEFTWLDYAVSQPGVVLHYLRLAFWPNALCLDYGWPVAKTAGEILPPALAILALLAATAWSFRRDPAWGFCGVWFFLILAPTSSIMPIQDLAFEHRMYLSLAAVAAAVVCGAYAGIARLRATGSYRSPALLVAASAIALLLAATLGYLTFQRNADYESEARMWGDVVAKHPDNWRGHTNLAQVLALQGDVNEGVKQAEEALRIDPRYADGHLNLAKALIKQGRLDEAARHCEEAVKMNPGYAKAHLELARALLEQGKLDEAMRQNQEALKITPNDEAAHSNLAVVLYKKGEAAEAMKEYETALKINSRFVTAHLNLANILMTQGKVDDAARHYEEALRFDPGQARTHLDLAHALAMQSKLEDAARHCREALKLEPNSATAHGNLGVVLDTQGKTGEAVREYEAALKINPRDVDARLNLAEALTAQGKLDEAARHCVEALKIKPDYAKAHVDLGRTLEKQGKTTEAAAHFREAARLRPGDAEALEWLKHHDETPRPQETQR